MGNSAPNLEFLDGSRLGSKLEAGRGLLVDFGSDAALKELVVDDRYVDRVDYIATGAKDECGLRGLLVRLGGIVVWVAESQAELDVGAAN